MNMNMLGEKYKILNILGKGNMGCVLLVEDIFLKKKYAMKMVPKESEERTKALEKEALILKTLSDRRLPYIVEMVENEETLGIVMEYVEGITLEEYLAKNAPLSEEEALNIFKELTDIVSYLHSRRPSVIFRDLKPANIMITPDKKIRLLDFGAALEGDILRKNSVVLGTYGFSAPEQVKGEGISSRSDIYALGAILFYMLTGINPSLPPYEIADIRKISLTVSEGSCRLVEKCCKKNPEERFLDGESLKREMPRYLEKKTENKLALLGIGYYLFLFVTAAFSGFAFMMLFRTGHVDIKSIWCIVLSLGICIFWHKYLKEQVQRKKFIKKREWNIIYTEKKTVGLWTLVMVIFLTTGCVKQPQEPFYVDVINADGQHVLIKDGSFYETGTELVFSVRPREDTVYEVYFYQRKEDEVFPTEHYFTFGQ